MRGRYECWLDGQGLTAIDESIILLDISEHSPRLTCITEANASYDGQRLLRQTRQSLTVTITFEVHEYDTVRRSRIIDQVCAWASGQVLTVSYRQDQQLHVACTSFPCVGSALRWTEKLTLALTAFALPYWESSRPTAAALAACKSGAVHLRPAGTAESCFLSGEVTGEGILTNTLRISCNGKHFFFTQLGLAHGETLAFGYDEQMLLFFRKGSASVLSKRTPDSADDLILLQRQDNAIALEADGAISARLWGRGLYL